LALRCAKTFYSKRVKDVKNFVPTVGTAVLLWQGLRGGLDDFGIAVALVLWVMMMRSNETIMDVGKSRKPDEEREKKLKDTESG
jgi:hypothetical protein